MREKPVKRHPPSPEIHTRWRAVVALGKPFSCQLLVAVLILGAGLPAARAATPSGAVVMVPGVTGSRLENPETGREIWGPPSRFFRPADRGHEIALSITRPGERRDRVRANGPLLFLRLMGWTKEVYRPLSRRLEEAGYALGEIKRPERSKSFYFFSYDWRRSNLEAVPQLHAALERIARERGDPEIDLICQSNANRICRYLAKYGNLPLDRIDTDEPPRSGYRLRKILFVGVSNGGALRQLHELDRGRRYVPGVGRYMGPETLFTLRPLFEDLPPPDERIFVDEQGRQLEVDLYDAENWVRYGWSIFSPAVSEELNRSKDPEHIRSVFGSPADRKAYLENRLRQARLLHEVLARDGAGFGDVGYYLLENGSLPTPIRAVLRENESVWETLFSTDRSARRLAQRITGLSAKGDGHASLQSQRSLSPQEKDAIRAIGSISGGHFQTIVLPETLDLVVEFLGR